ncbi:MAG: flagellin FliC3 [Roseburia sp.]|nr:flagellin FliC3 [Roseburia sp.]MCM1279319.1 flagellin FliC3 [Robinsoniella sp.]
MKVNYNLQAIIANKSLSTSENNLAVSSTRLSSGYKINDAKDNPSGIAIAKRMNAQLKGLDKALQNATDGISVVQTAEGALAEIQEMIQRMSELSIRAATGTMTEGDRELVMEEVSQLKSEIVRVAETTDFNGQNLLNGECDLRGYTNQAGAKVEYYSDDVQLGKYLLTITPAFDADGNLTDATSVNFGTATAGEEAHRFDSSCITKVKGDTITIIDAMQNEVMISIDKDTFAGAGTEMEIDLTGIGAMRFQIGANEGQVLPIRIPTISLKHMGIDTLDVSTAENAEKAIAQLSEANDYISAVRSRIGAYQNRLEHAQTNLEASSESVTSAYSSIMDVNMATEMTEYTKLQVLTQAGTSMLAQANERPQQILQLLQ